ncbi:hypothetical protein GJR96_11470 [Haloferax sp. MBLA0076]|uniref:Uncharacterized protein n=1 Tax=Haloferax litoreum TaxID=2666140 RepID=A0A6A8GLK4_9EURY|nr:MULTISPECIES: hypothetical protein [Haloferax]KAB1194021.1 hypothetical protein Hfx1148_11420 [Haloferax sp. CBA1148]MRX22570.1 hypothetical protein [Haloferax litoreum]
MSKHTTRRRFLVAAGLAGTTLLAGCTGSTGGGNGGTMGTATTEEMTTESTTEQSGSTPTDPESAPRATVDRFSEAAGTLMVRTDENGLPGPDEAVDFDGGPFITQGLGPDGEVVRYYNFDVQATTPAPIYALFREGEDTPVEGQLNVIDVIPGDEGYNDFWHVHKVTVPEDYEANTATSLADIEDAGYEMEATDMLVNCPVVPDGSTASMRYGDEDTGLVEGWYQGMVVSYFQFTEAALTLSGDSVPLSPIYVTFNVNPGEDGGGPPSGFVTEDGSDQTHNVVATLPDDSGYSPLWFVNIYDNADFDAVSDLGSATDAEQLASGAANVNCPIVSVE